MDAIYWSRLSGLPRKVYWPVHVVKWDEPVEAWCNSDQAFFRVSSNQLLPFPGPNFDDLKKLGIDILEKKKQFSTVEAFKQDLEWAIAETVATKDGEVTESNPSAELSRQLKVYMDTLTKNNWRDVLKAAKEEMKNVSVSGRRAAAVLDEDDFDVLHLLSTVKQNCPLHLSDRDSIAVLFHLVSDLVVKGVYAIDIDPEEIDQACAESFRKLVEVMKEMKAQPGSEEMITQNDLVQDNGVESDVVPIQSEKQLMDNVIKDVKIPGSEEMITEDDLVQDKGVERDVVQKQSDEQLMDNMIKDFKIPGSEERITIFIEDRVEDSGDESDVIPVAGAESVKMPVKAPFPELALNKISPIPIQSVKQLVDLSDSDEDIDESNIIRDVKIRGLFIKKVIHSIATKGGKMKKDQRVYNSYHYCCYCKRLVSNFSQHIKRRHLKKEDVNAIFDTENGKSRKMKLSLLSAKMDNEFNVENLKKGKGEILLFRRPAEKFDVTQYGPCPNCRYWMSKKMMQRHQITCLVGGQALSISDILTRSDVLSKRIEVEVSPALIKEVFSSMQNDVIGETARSDPLIISLGNMWLEKNVGNKLKRGKYTRQIMRLVARLLLYIQEETQTNFCLSEYLKPCFFNEVAKATLKTAGNDISDPEYLENPSNAIKLGHDLKRVVSIDIAYAIMNGDDAKKKDGENFLHTMKVFWGTRVTKLARNILTERQFNKRVVLPDPEDIKTLNAYLNSELSHIDVGRVDLNNYTYIAKLLCAKLVQYNRRRPGEIEAVRLKDYEARSTGTAESTVLGELTAFEKKLIENQDVVTVRGKGHRGVPIIVPEAAKKGLEYVTNMAVRRRVGIADNSAYLFATTGGIGEVFRVYDALADFCGKANLSFPERITATTLRKYMATITQVLDLKPHQLEWVMRHMGHSLDVHKIYYRCTSDVIERTQIAKILLLQDSGRISEFCNKSLEDIQLEELAEEACAGPDDVLLDVPLEELFVASENMDVDDEYTNLEETRAGHTAKKNSSATRQKWSSGEENEIRQIFEKYFEEKSRPTPKQCSKAIRISKKKGGLIHLRKKDVLKKKLWRMIDNLEK